MNVSGLFGLILLMILAGACAPKPRGEEPLQAIDRAITPHATESLPPAAPPPQIRAALLPEPVTTPRGLPPSEESYFDISADRVAARAFFLGLVKGTNTNMVVHPKVAGEISVTLKRTTVPEVLEIVNNVYGYPYIKTGSTYQVMPLGLQSRTFAVDYINLVRQGQSETRVNSGQVTQGDNSEDNVSSTSKEQKPASLISTSSNSDFWSDLTHALQGIVGTEDGRVVVVQPQASAVVVVAMPDELQQVDVYLQTIKQNLRRQVVIEARIIEVTLDDGFQSGINWGSLMANSAGDSLILGQTGGGQIFSNGTSGNAGVSGSLAEGGILPDVLGTAAFGGVFSAALNLKDFNAFIELLQQQGDVQVLSSPRISTVNNQKAVIKVGTDEFFLTDVSSDTVTGTSSNNSVDVTLTPFFSGIALDVTPQIDAQGAVVLHVHPTVSEVVDQTKQLSVFGGTGSTNQTLSLPLAKSTVRETDSIIRANSGQIVMIGGLMKDKQTTQEAGIPLLSDLPLLGGLFRHNKTLSQKSELVILLRPQVMVQPQDWNQLLERSRLRIQAMSPQFKRDWLPRP